MLPLKAINLAPDIPIIQSDLSKLIVHIKPELIRSVFSHVPAKDVKTNGIEYGKGNEKLKVTRKSKPGSQTQTKSRCKHAGKSISN